MKSAPKHNVEHYIETNGAPVHARPRPLPPHRYLAVKKEFDHMIEQQLCRPSKSPWASPLHVVPKKNGDIRVCGDYRRLNCVTKPDRYPVPRLRDFTYQLHGMNIFSTIDLNRAYQQIPMHKNHIDKTAIITPFGLFEFPMMREGLKNAGQTFQRFIHQVLAGLDYVFPFIDDIIIASKDAETHENHLRTVLQRLNEYGVTINPSKCVLGQESVKFLGYTVTPHGIKPPEDKIQTINSYPKPENIEQLRRFLGMVNFYHDSIPNAAQIQTPLNVFLHNCKKRDKTVIQWNPEADEAFEAYLQLAHDKKTDRMRSWYLYEQYRALTQHQLDAAQRLRNRSVQEQLLHQELTERRARRSPFCQISMHLSDPNQDCISQATYLSNTNDDFYESFSDLHDFEGNNSLGSHHGTDNNSMEDKNLEDFQEDTSCADSVSSVVDATDRSSKHPIAEKIKLNLQTVKDNMASLEKYAQMTDGEHNSETSVDSLGWRNVLRKDVRNNQLFYMWTRLVAFAYHIIQLNHGNCYYDYSSQLLTAVLACDALRRGVNRMCDILQYYVSPVKYASDSEDSSNMCRKKRKKKKSHGLKKLRKSSKYKINSSSQKKVTRRFEDDHHAEHSSGSWQHYRKYSVVHTMEQNRKHRQPRRREWRKANRSTIRRSHQTLWPSELETTDSTTFEGRSPDNPMVLLVRYLDDVIKTDARESE
ncbi:uncharacterized protein LOC134667643 [Cydia fagiglandana]|uniref:uncharacterized protein LOC134667643 n=1 Tax=Cydia fagiglandana TaxID=1458189 RepID=UPI002FEE3FA7